MRRTKSKVENPLSSSTRNIGTQTAHFDSFAEIAKLQEQVKLLQLQNDDLKQHTKTSKKSIVTKQYKQLYTEETSKNSEKHSCTCKGNCSSRICGCVKKNNKCNSLCKCNDKTCQNQELEYDKENINKDNIDKKTPKRQSTKSKTVEITKNSRSLFSPDMLETHKDYDKYKKTHTDLEETQISDVHSNNTNIVHNEDIVMGNLEANKTLDINVTARKKTKNKEQQQVAVKIENDVTNDTETHSIASKENENVRMFDPMKPKHQLSRTPPNKKFTDKSLEMDNIIESKSHHEPHCNDKDRRIISSIQVLDVKEEKIDWQQHTAQLVSCKKCKRTFLPDRIQKHEACCKQI